MQIPAALPCPITHLLPGFLLNGERVVRMLASATEVCHADIAVGACRTASSGWAWECMQRPRDRQTRREQSRQARKRWSMEKWVQDMRCMQVPNMMKQFCPCLPQHQPMTTGLVLTNDGLGGALKQPCHQEIDQCHLQLHRGIGRLCRSTAVRRRLTAPLAALALIWRTRRWRGGRLSEQRRLQLLQAGKPGARRQPQQRLAKAAHKLPSLDEHGLVLQRQPASGDAGRLGRRLLSVWQLAVLCSAGQGGRAGR